MVCLLNVVCVDFALQTVEPASTARTVRSAVGVRTEAHVTSSRATASARRASSGLSVVSRALRGRSVRAARRVVAV